jgi:uncharacterized protein YdaU (DUF1376 family)
MRNFTIYLTGFLCLFLTTVFSQETFESRAKGIAAKIETITKEEKSALKTEVETVNTQLENGSLTKEQAEAKKEELAELRAKNIETRVAAVQDELKNLVQEKVDGKITESDSTRSFTFHFDPKKHKKENNGESRTTTQVVFALGVNNIMTNNRLAHSDFKYWGSHFYEFGLESSTRIFKNNNLLHARYGLSLMYNNLRPTDNRYFVESGTATNLVNSPIHLKDSRFHNVYVAVPFQLEFDFGKKEVKDGKNIFKTHQTFRLGVGGYAAANIKSKQILEYEVDGHDVKEKTKGNYNVNDFIGGVSAYVGYKDLSLYAKYDLTPVFHKNNQNQNNVSLGLRWDWN